jgi:hypothetical protein
VKYEDLYATIDLAKLKFSILIVTPKENFLLWLKQFTARKGLARYRIYLPEENSVWIIPKIDFFPESAPFSEFLNDLKPKMLLEELYKFGATPGDFGETISEGTFDKFLEVTLRSGALLASDLSSL